MSDAQYLAALQLQLDKEIAGAHAAEKPPGLQEVAAIVRQVVHSLKSDASAVDLKFYTELEELAQTIRHAREEIAAIQPKDIRTDHIPRATDELDAVVGATEEATNKIMDVCDEITALAGNCMPEMNQKLIKCTTKIFEACNFQDITGQRITKVVTTLKYIDSKVAALLTALGEELHRAEGEGKDRSAASMDAEKALLNGPQLAKEAISQDDIDKLMSGN